MPAWLNLLPCGLVLLVLAGCETPAPIVPVVEVVPTARETFQQVVTDLKGDLEPSNDHGSMVVSGGSSRSLVRYSIDGTYLPPSGASTGPKGIVHVHVNTIFVSTKPIEEIAQPDKPDRLEPLAGSPSDESTKGIDPKLLAEAPQSAPTSRDMLSVPQRRHTLDETTKYELSFIDGRWKLDSQLNPDFESALQIAFDRALSGQFDAKAE